MSILHFHEDCTESGVLILASGFRVGVCLVGAGIEGEFGRVMRGRGQWWVALAFTTS